MSVLILTAVARADEVVLQNGDRLTGRIVHKSGETLTLESDYGGKITIRWKSVASLSTDAPVELILNDERRIRARLGAAPSTEGGEGRAESDDAAGGVRLDRITFINPTPVESGIGTVSSGHAGVSSATTSGNTSGTRTYGDADYTVRGKRYRWSVSGKANRVTDSGEQTASSWLAGGDYDRFISDDRFLYLRASAERDRFKDVELRSALGGGYGLQLIEDERTKVSLRGGLDYVVVDRVVSPNERYPALGWGVKASHKFNGAGSEVFHEHDGFWNLRERGHVTIRSRTGLRMPLVGNLTATLQVNFDWDREPADDLKPADTTVVLGLGYTF
jgi:putative salt-induced outer membrane protein YdiY